MGELQGAELKAWRRSERQRLLALRTAVPPVERRLWGREIEVKNVLFVSSKLSEMQRMVATKPDVTTEA